MVNLLALILPVIVPSWRFFDDIRPSPRIEVRWVGGDEGAWQEHRPRPVHLPYLARLGRLFWNPEWNETLFLVSLSERMVTDPSSANCRLLAARIGAGMTRRTSGQGPEPGQKTAHAFADQQQFQFRLVLVMRNGARLGREVVFVSDPVALSHNAGSAG